jgi:hypothetical protein
MADNILVEQREYHQTTHYINREIPTYEIVAEFGDLETFNKGFLDTDHADFDGELSDKVNEFLDGFDYDRVVDEWTMRKGGYDVDLEVVDKFTMTEDK